MRVTTPVKDFTGTVVGVSFTHGAGETDDPTALAYFARHGYTTSGKEDEDIVPAPTATVEDEAPTQEAPDEADAGPVEDGPAVRPAGNASKQAWYEFALASGFSADELDGLDRNELRELVAD